MNSSFSRLDEEREGPDVSAPTVTEFISPRWFFGFLHAFIGSWLISRNYRAFLAGGPALIFAFASAVAIWRLAAPPEETLAAAYERAAVNASRLDSHAESDLMWERLMQLRPGDNKYRFVLATDLAERGELTEAARHLEVLTGDPGYAPARLWLVNQARQDSPSFPLTTDQQIAQLQATIQEEPSNTDAHRLLAQIHIEREDYRVAEQHLLHAADSHPTLGLLLYELQIKLQRKDAGKSLRYLLNAARGFEQIVIQTPDNAEARIYWSQTLDYLGRTTEAEAVLTEALHSHDTPELREATAAYMIRQAQRLVTQSPLNAPIASVYLTKAAEIRPENSALAPLCIALAGMGAEFSKEGLQPLVAHLTALVDSNPDELRNRLLLGHLLTILKQYDRATELLAPSQDNNPSIQSLLVRIYRLSGKVQDAEQLTISMLTALRAAVNAAPDQPEPILQLAGGLVSTERHEEAITAIDQWGERTGQELHDVPASLRQLYVASCVAAFHRQSAANPDDDNAFDILEKATDTREVSSELLQLVARLAYGKGRFTVRADDMLTRILAAGQVNERIYASVGTEALAGGNPEAAVGHLRLALAQAPHNPVIQNNLALALVRHSADNAGPAMEMCNQALETVPGQPDVLSTRAEIHIARKRWPEARMDLETVLPQRPRSIVVRELLVRVYTELQEPGLAAEHQKVLDELRKAELEAASSDS